jgi:hypothetical protein
MHRHIPPPTQPQEFIEAVLFLYVANGMTIEYLQGDKGPVPDAKLEEVAKLTHEAGAWVVPTMLLWETLRGTADLAALRALPELQYMPH